jgi:hypothetical protein
LGDLDGMFTAPVATLIYAFLLLLVTATAHAATITVLPLERNDLAVVVIAGTIEFADKDEFLRKISPLSKAIVSFSSDGGSLVAGLQIGETIRLKNFSTLVSDQEICASACALAWLGGTKRLMGPQAQIGFHAAYDGETRRVTGSGNALVGAYLNKIGLPYGAVVYLTSASPDSITWLSKSDAEKLGIEVSLFDGPPPKDTVANGRYVAIAFSRKDPSIYAKSDILPTADGAQQASIYSCQRRATDCIYTSVANQCVGLAVSNKTTWGKYGPGGRRNSDPPGVSTSSPVFPVLERVNTPQAPVFGTGHGATQSEAEAFALDSCLKFRRSVTQSCKVVTSGCAYSSGQP